MLQVNDFSFAINNKTILEQINFSVLKGEYLAIIGPNGAGKSTLLKCLMRLHEEGQSTGSIHIVNQPLASYSQKQLAKRMAYVPQAGGFIPPFTVNELLSLSRYPYDIAGGNLQKDDIEIIERALSLTKMESLATRHLQTLSGGERQKAFLAAALAQNTEILLLDEPASFLDPKHAADLNKLIQTLHQKQGLTIITVTHDLNHPLEMDGKILVLQQGKQYFLGDASQLLQQRVLEQAYQHEFTYIQHPRTGKTVVLVD